jgi:hypothetical protein
MDRLARSADCWGIREVGLEGTLLRESGPAGNTRNGPVPAGERSTRKLMQNALSQLAWGSSRGTPQSAGWRRYGHVDCFRVAEQSKITFLSAPRSLEALHARGIVTQKSKRVSPPAARRTFPFMLMHWRTGIAGRCHFGLERERLRSRFVGTGVKFLTVRDGWTQTGEAIGPRRTGQKSRSSLPIF